MNQSAEAVLSFAIDAQDEAPLRAAAYRMAGSACCEVDRAGGDWICRVTSSGPNFASEDFLKRRFLAILNDENLREQIEARVAPVRNVILALAFGALVRDPPPPT